MKPLARLACLLFVPVLVCAATEVKKISPAKAARLVAEGRAVLVDVREPGEWVKEGVAAPAVLLPKSDFDRQRKLWAPFLEKNAGKQIILYCYNGQRAATVGRALAEQGHAVANAGGLKDWIEAGLPTRPAKP